MTAAPPFGNGSISFGLSAVDGTAEDIVAALRREVAAAASAGFDGVTISEHHGGFAGYLPTPILLSAVLLAALDDVWACAGPSVLPLRSTATVVEDLAWLEAAYPGRVGAGFVAGYQKRDFELVGADFDGRSATFWAQLQELTDELSGTGAAHLRLDPAVAALTPRGLPIVCGVGGPVGASRAAQAGAGLLLMSLAAAAKSAELIRRYRGSGGSGPCVLIRRVQFGSSIGPVAAKLARWRSASDEAQWLRVDADAVALGSSTEIAARLAHDISASQATALNIRIDCDSSDLAQRTARINRFGEEVLPMLRQELGWRNR
jgi:alkanesulfonate monooxygenase SsuD/methylene tetrahydromethanopterin reductase-like flavin-dependent oxidoreductase (luciferase family)